MRFRLIDAAKKDFPVARLCKVLDVSPSGYFAGRTAGLDAAARGSRAACPRPIRLHALARDVWQPAHDPRAARQGLAAGRRRVARLMRGRRAQSPPAAPLPAHDGQRPRLSSRAQPPRPGLHGGRAGSQVGKRHLLHLDAGGLVVPGGGPRSVLPTGRGLGGGRPASQGTRADRAATCPCRPTARTRFIATFRPRQSVLFE